MLRYHFHLHDGCGFADDEGMLLPSLAEARRYAADFFGLTVRDAGARLFQCEDWRLEVTDCDGLVLFVLQLNAFDVPAVNATACPAAAATA